MSTKWDDTSWQEEFLEMKTHKPEVVRLLMEIFANSTVPCDFHVVK